MMRPREAPIASRVATSRRRSSARASSIAATLLQAISSTSPVSAPSTRDESDHRAGDAAPECVPTGDIDRPSDRAASRRVRSM